MSASGSASPVFRTARDDCFARRATTASRWPGDRDRGIPAVRRSHKKQQRSRTTSSLARFRSAHRPGDPALRCARRDSWAPGQALVRYLRRRSTPTLPIRSHVTMRRDGGKVDRATRYPDVLIQNVDRFLVGEALKRLSNLRVRANECGAGHTHRVMALSRGSSRSLASLGTGAPPARAERPPSGVYTAPSGSG